MADNRSRRRALFDLRSLIAVVLGVYGIVLTILGAVNSSGQVAKGDGIRINLWSGLALIVVAIVLVLWQIFGGEASRTGESETDAVESTDDSH